MNREEAIEMWVIPALKNTWNEKKCDEILKALKKEPCENCVSREAVLDLCDSKDEEYKVRHFKEDVECLPPVTLQPCGDCISRQAAICLADELKDDLPDDDSLSDIVMSHNEGLLEYQTKLSLLPSVAPAEKVGRWEYVQYDGNPNIGNWHCSECNRIVCGAITAVNPVYAYKYCPNCGAKMEVESYGL